MVSPTEWLRAYLATLTAEVKLARLPAGGWEAVAAVAESEGLAPALAFGLARRPDPDVPAAVATRLDARFKQAVARHIVMSRDLAIVLRGLARMGVPTIVLKGAYLAEAAYPHPALRPMSDVDVLVHRHDRLRVDALLRDLGYRPGADAHSWAFDLAYDSATFY